MNENQNTLFRLLWHTANLVLSGKYIATKTISKNLKIPNAKQNLHLNDVEKEQQIELKPTRRREIIKIRAEINEIETRRIAEQINKVEASSLNKLINTYKPLASLIQKKR